MAIGTDDFTCPPANETKPAIKFNIPHTDMSKNHHISSVFNFDFHMQILVDILKQTHFSYVAFKSLVYRHSIYDVCAESPDHRRDVPQSVRAAELDVLASGGRHRGLTPAAQLGE